MINMRMFLVYIYIVPTLISLAVIYHTGYLLGDFRGYSYAIDSIDVLGNVIKFIFPIFLFFLFVKVSDKLKFIQEKDNSFESLSFFLFIYIFFVTFIFGAIKIGVGDVSGGYAGLLMSTVIKLNPYLLLSVLAFSKIKTTRFLFCLFVAVFFSYKQISMQGYLVALFSLSVFILNRVRINSLVISLVLLIPFVFYNYLFEVLSYIYSVRNEMRGVTFDVTEVSSLALGRVSSLSSYLYITDNAFDFSRISDFFSLGIYLERLIGFSLFATNSPSSVFNLSVLGDADYSIFLGLNGFLYSLYEVSLGVLILNVMVLMFFLFITFQLMPFFEKKKRPCVFFLVIYMNFLSFDIWEFSMLFQSLIVINVLYYFLHLCRVVRSKIIIS